MALAPPSLRIDADATRRAGRVSVATTVPLKQRPDAPAARGGEGMRREHVRMELLVDRARAARRRLSRPQPPMCDISTFGRSSGVLAERSSE